MKNDISEELEFERVYLLIDGGFFDKVLQHLGEPQINYETFSDAVCKHAKGRRMRTYYYHCLPYKNENNKTDSERYSQKQNFFKTLNRLSRFEVKLGKIQKTETHCNNCKNIKVEYKQKRVDNKLVVDIVSLSWRGLADKIVFLGGDSDLYPAFEEAKEAGVIIHLFYYNSDNNATQNQKIRVKTHDELFDLFDERTELTKEFIENFKLNVKK